MPNPATGIGKVIAVLIQSVAVQALGLGFFYLLSIYLSTEAFGLLSWCSAVCVFLTTVAGFGLEQVVMRRVAAGNVTSGWAATAFMLHSLAGSAVILAILLVLRATAGSDHPGIALLPLFFVVQSVATLVLPMKLLLNAKARYMPYAVIALLSNAGRIVAAIIYLRGGYRFSVEMAAIIMLAFNVAELVAMALYVRLTRTSMPFRVPLRGYKRLLREASPQYLSVLFDISLARADWILLGILSNDTATGYYTFAYRAFEMLRIPAVAVGLLLMPRIAPVLSKAGRLDDRHRSMIGQFFRIEMWAVCAAVLLMNVLWTPVVGTLTNDRYGAANATEAGLLALCLPLHFAINLMWILAFASRKYAALARITLVVSIINIAANVVLIPLLGGKGAALAFLTASLVQAVMYYLLLSRAGIRLQLSPIAISLAAAVACAAVPQLFTGIMPVGLFVSISIGGYMVLTYMLRQWRLSDITFIKQMLAR